jgi:hypothetical protein
MSRSADQAYMVRGRHFAEALYRRAQGLDAERMSCNGVDLSLIASLLINPVRQLPGRAITFPKLIEFGLALKHGEVHGSADMLLLQGPGGVAICVVQGGARIGPRAAPVVRRNPAPSRTASRFGVVSPITCFPWIVG